MLLKVTVLICAGWMSPQDCTSDTAIDVIQGPDATNEVTCAMQAQAYLAQTTLAPAGKTYMKVVCRRDRPLVGEAALKWGGRRPAARQ